MWKLLSNSGCCCYSELTLLEAFQLNLKQLAPFQTTWYSHQMKLPMMKQFEVLFHLCLLMSTSGAKIHKDTKGTTTSWIGKTVAFHNPFWNRFMRMNGAGWLDSSGVGNVLHDGWTWERFQVVDAGSGYVALHSTHFNRMVMMTDQQGMKAGALMGPNELPQGNAWEKFRLVDAGGGKWALHSPYFNRFAWMDGNHNMAAGGIMKEDHLPPGNAWERFVIIESTYTASCPNLYHAVGASCKADLIGKTVAFHNPFHNRFMRMNEQGWVDGSGVGNTLPDGWTWERFKIVDVGDEEVALYSIEHSRYVMMNDQQQTRVSALFAEMGLPRNNAWERFRVVDALNGQVAFHNGFFNRFLMMNNQGDVIAGGVMAANALPAAGHAWERFVAQITTFNASCPYLSYPVGASCKTWLIGQHVAFYNDFHQKFMQMDNAGAILTSVQMPIDYLCYNCQWERFLVVDIGGGNIGLYNSHQKRYLMMTDQQTMSSSSVMDWGAFPPGNSWEKLRVVDAFNGEIALHSPFFNRFVMMTNQGTMVPTGPLAPTALPTGNQWERLTVAYTGEHQLPSSFESNPGKRCRGEPYTRDGCNLANCNGWNPTTLEECVQKCENNEIPQHCSADFTCKAAVWEGGGQCHLYSICPELEDDGGSTTMRKWTTTMLLQNESRSHQHQSPSQLQLASEYRKPSQDPLDSPAADLAMAFPLVLINVTNFTGLVTNTGGHLDVTHKFGNFTSDLALFYEKVFGFYLALHGMMGPEANRYCPMRMYKNFYDCLHIAACHLQKMVPAIIEMEYYAAMMEQMGRFDITWEQLLAALDVETKMYDGPPEFKRLPPQYICDGVGPADQNHMAIPTYKMDTDTEKVYQGSFVQMDAEHSQILATSAHLERASSATIRILEATNMSDDLVLKELHQLWAPLCEEMKCDHTNGVDIFLSSHRQTMSLMQAGASASHVSSEIYTRVKLERSIQANLPTKPILVQFWRDDETSLHAAEEYGALGNAAVTRFLKRFLKSTRGQERIQRAIDMVEYEKFRARKSAKYDKMSRAMVVNSTGATALVNVGSMGFWSWLTNLVSCFGSFSRFYFTGYSKQLSTHCGFGFGAAGGDSAKFQDLIQGAYPSGFVAAFAAFTVGTASEWFILAAESSRAQESLQSRRESAALRRLLRCRVVTIFAAKLMFACHEVPSTCMSHEGVAGAFTASCRCLFPEPPGRFRLVRLQVTIRFQTDQRFCTEVQGAFVFTICGGHGRRHRHNHQISGGELSDLHGF
eukprot:s26_g50.t1